MAATSILIVEDELIIAADLRRQLLALGYLVCDIVGSVAEARKVIAARAADLVLLDIQLHGQEPGTILGKELRETADLPFIYITSHTDRATVADAKLTRPSGYLVKPFTKEDVYVAIEIAISNHAHRLIDEIPTTLPDELIVKAPGKIKRSVAYIRDNLDRRVTLSELAELTGWNVYHFARRFKEYLGESPYQFALKARIDAARTRLVTTQLAVGKIALDLGFDSHSHFSQVFRKQEGCSPESYREKYQ